MEKFSNISILTKTFNDLPIGVGVFYVPDLNDIKSIEYVFMNKVLLYEMRKESHEVIGKKITEVAPEAFDHEGGRLVMETYRKIAKDGGKINLGLIEYSNHMVAGTYECSVHHIQSNYVYVMLRNVTELEQIKRELEIKNTQLELKNKEIEEFVYIASHDLQEPLRTMTSIVNFLKEDYGNKLDETAHKYFNLIENGAARMKQLIRDLLDYSKTAQSEELKEINLNQLLEELKSDLSDLIIRTNTSIEIDDLPNVKGSKTELRLLFQNLISNAIKFRKPDVSPIVKVGVEKRGFYVSDNGIGIDEQNKENIFKIFKRLHSQKEYEGTGIGLAHCLKIIKKYGGNIWVESTVGKGSKFLFTVAN